jgi:hypothetical protein
MKRILFVFVLFIIVVTIFACAFMILSKKRNTFQYDGWIDCMPPLSESQAKLCEEAKAANYPYIAY